MPYRFAAIAVLLIALGSSMQAWTYQYESASGWTEVTLTSEESDLGFHCAGRSRRGGAASADLPWLTQPGEVILSFGPNAIPVSARALDNVVININGQPISLPTLQHSEQRGVYWAPLPMGHPLFDALDDRFDMQIEIDGVVQSTVAIKDAAYHQGSFLTDCRTLTGE